MRNEWIITIVFLSALVVGIHGQMRWPCDVCIDQSCFESVSVLEGFDVKSLAYDSDRGIIFAHSHQSVLKIGFHGSNGIHFQIQVIQNNNVTALTIDQTTGTLYTADHFNNIYAIKYEENSDVKLIHSNIYSQPDQMFYKDGLYYTTSTGEVRTFINNEDQPLNHFEDKSIENLIFDSIGTIYYLSNDTVYRLVNGEEPETIVDLQKAYKLGIDRENSLFLVDNDEMVIYKWNSEIRELKVYAAFQTGNMGSIMLHNNDRKVVLDTTNGNVYFWLHSGRECVIHRPTSTYSLSEYDGEARFCRNQEH